MSSTSAEYWQQCNLHIEGLGSGFKGVEQECSCPRHWLPYSTPRIKPRSRAQFDKSQSDFLQASPLCPLTQVLVFGSSPSSFEKLHQSNPLSLLTCPSSPFKGTPTLVELPFDIQAIIWVVVKIMVPYWGTLNIRCRIIIRIQKGTIILTTTHITAALKLR